MKQNKSMWIAAALMVPLVALVSFFSVKEAKESGGINMFVFGQAKLRNTIEIPLSEANQLEVEYGSKNLKIYSAESDTIVIKEYLHSDDEKAEYTIANNKATVKSKNTFTFVFFGTGERIEIYLPKEGIETLELKASSGNITADETFGIKTGQVSVVTSSGNIKWNDTQAKTVSFTASSGNVKAQRIEADEIAVATASGNIDVENITGKLTAAATSGNVSALQISGYGSMTASSGNVKAEMDEVTGDMQLKANSGSVKLFLPKDLSFDLEVQTGSGNIDTDFDEYLSYNKKGNQVSGRVGAEASCKISAEAGSGNVKIMVNQ